MVACISDYKTNSCLIIKFNKASYGIGTCHVPGFFLPGKVHRPNRSSVYAYMHVCI